jgi:hypothetical protein
VTYFKKINPPTILTFTFLYFCINYLQLIKKMEVEILSNVLPFLDNLDIPNLLLNKTFYVYIFDHFRHICLSLLKQTTTSTYGNFHAKKVFLQFGEELIHDTKNITQMILLSQNLSFIVPFSDILTDSLKLINQFSDYKKIEGRKFFTILVNVLSLPSFRFLILRNLPDCSLFSHYLSCFIPGFEMKCNLKFKRLEQYFKKHLKNFSPSFETLVNAQIHGGTQKLTLLIKQLLEIDPMFPTDLVHLVFNFDIKNIAHFHLKLQCHPFYSHLTTEEHNFIVKNFCPNFYFVHDYQNLLSRIETVFASLLKLNNFTINYKFLVFMLSFIHPSRISTIFSRLETFIDIFEFEIEENEYYQGFLEFIRLTDDEYHVFKKTLDYFFVGTHSCQLLYFFKRLELAEYINILRKFYELHYNVFPNVYHPILIILMEPFDFWHLLRFKKKNKLLGDKLPKEEWLQMTLFKAHQVKYVNTEYKKLKWDEYINYFLPTLSLPKLKLFCEQFYSYLWEYENLNSLVNNVLRLIQAMNFFDIEQIYQFDNPYHMMNVFNNIQELKKNP